MRSGGQVTIIDIQLAMHLYRCCRSCCGSDAAAGRVEAAGRGTFAEWRWSCGGAWYVQRGAWQVGENNLSKGINAGRTLQGAAILAPAGEK